MAVQSSSRLPRLGRRLAHGGIRLGSVSRALPPGTGPGNSVSAASISLSEPARRASGRCPGFKALHVFRDAYATPSASVPAGVGCAPSERRPSWNPGLPR
jgi:hypothetical protein